MSKGAGSRLLTCRYRGASKGTRSDRNLKRKTSAFLLLQWWPLELPKEAWREMDVRHRQHMPYCPQRDLSVKHLKTRKLLLERETTKPVGSYNSECHGEALTSQLKHNYGIL